MRIESLWSDETKIELVSVSEYLIWKKAGTAHHRVVLLGCLAAGTWRVVRVEGKLNGVKHRGVLNEKPDPGRLGFQTWQQVHLSTGQ